MVIFLHLERRCPWVWALPCLLAGPASVLRTFIDRGPSRLLASANFLLNFCTVQSVHPSIFKAFMIF